MIDKRKEDFYKENPALVTFCGYSSHNYEICLRISCNTNLIKIRFTNYLNRFADIFESHTES